jgi:hypothetical protein
MGEEGNRAERAVVFCSRGASGRIALFGAHAPDGDLNIPKSLQIVDLIMKSDQDDQATRKNV